MTDTPELDDDTIERVLNTAYTARRALRGELDGVDHSPHPLEIERAERIARAKVYADRAGDEGLFAETRAAWAAAGMLELAIVQAEDPRFAPPF